MNYKDDRYAGEDSARADDDMAEREGGGGEPDTFEMELDGQVHTLPAALKGAFLRQADYTRKTQELAHHRRALEAERAAVAEMAQAHQAAGHHRVRLAAMDHHLEGFRDVDWDGYAKHDPDAARALWSRFQELTHSRHAMAQAVAHHEHGERMRADREAAEAMAETGRALARDIPGWSPELAAKLSDYAVTQGVTLDELKAAADPRIWKVLHKAFQAEQAGRGEAASKASTVRPAVSVAGAAAGSGGVRDELGTKEWMRRRSEQVRRAR